MSNPTHTALPTLVEAFEPWLEQAGTRPRRQPPDEELLAEHHVMGAVLLAMEGELERMKGGGPLRPAFWSDVVDFNGNFVHLCHRVKEEQHLIPALVEAGAISTAELKTFHLAHQRAKDLTLGLRDGVEQGDWEKVLRIVVLYVHLMRAHMREEETELFRRAREAVSGAASAAQRAAFDRVEAEALGASGREHYLKMARSMVAATGVRYELA